jgi:hypothetical protein
MLLGLTGTGVLRTLVFSPNCPFRTSPRLMKILGNEQNVLLARAAGSDLHGQMMVERVQDPG